MKQVDDLIMQMIEEEFNVRNIELPDSVTSDVIHWTNEYLGQGMTPEQVAEKLFNEIFSYKKYDINKFAYPDSVNRDTSWGWVLSPEGVMYHLRHQQTHGLVIAALEPAKALLNKYIAPPMFSKYDCMSRFEYQYFGFDATRLYGWVRYDQIGGFLRIDFYAESVTQEQVDTMKDWFKYHDLLDNKCDTYYIESTIRNTINFMQESVSERKLGKPAEDMILIEPDANDFGLGL